MVTSSFDKNFVIKDVKIAEQFLQSLQTQKKIKVADRDFNAETKKGLKLLKMLVIRLIDAKQGLDGNLFNKFI